MAIAGKEALHVVFLNFEQGLSFRGLWSLFSRRPQQNVINASGGKSNLYNVQ